MRKTSEQKEPPAWKLYERLAMFVESQQGDPSLTVTPNVKLTGYLSGIERQIDILIDCRVGSDSSRRVIVDAKLHARPLDVKDVEQFEGMMRDVRADRGILVCPRGFSPGAARRAQKGIGIKLLRPEELDAVVLHTWDVCASDECTSSRIGRYEGWVLYDEVFHAGFPDESVAAVAVGKCDVCSCFNVWCWECGQKFALEGNESEAGCACSRFWLTSIESDGMLDDGTELMSVYLTVVMVYDGLAARATVSRRPLN